MDNATRSERSRNAVLEAAIVIIARDGPGRLTLDAIARESGISKGGLMHQFRSKEAVLKALLDRHTAYFDDFNRAYMVEHGATQAQPHLAMQIATLREGAATPRSLFFALFGAAAEEPGLLSDMRAGIVEHLKAMKAEATDPELTVLRWMAAWGLNLTTLLGLSPFSTKEREVLFDRLLDERQWSAASPAGEKPRAKVAPAHKAKAR